MKQFIARSVCTKKCKSSEQRHDWVGNLPAIVQDIKIKYETHKFLWDFEIQTDHQFSVENQTIEET